MRNHLRRSATLAASSAVLVATLVVAQAAPALADTSQATANAINVPLLLTSGVVSASNDGTNPNPGIITGNTNPALSVLGSQSLLSVGVLPQQAKAFDNGTSAACAGLVGTGGTIQIGDPPNAGDCTTSNLPTGGVNLSLGNLGGLTGTLGLKADAILAQCTASSNGTTTATVQLVNASLNLSPLGLSVINVPLLAGSGTNVVPDLGLLKLGNLLTVTINEQASSGPGQIFVTALHVNVLGLVDLRLGSVSCGPNASAPPIPAIPVKGLPFAAATVFAAGLVGLGVRRRRAAARVAD